MVIGKLGWEGGRGDIDGKMWIKISAVVYKAYRCS